jgi:hypothetical protein
MPEKKTKSRALKARTASKKDVSESYNRRKEFGGKQYTGMTIGRTHHWLYDQNSWKEKKVTPEKWEFTYATTKRRKGSGAPEGSGAPVGTGYHWFILAHQYVGKLNANDYSTQMVGLKFKLAHKRAAGQKWSASPEKRRKDLIEILKALIADLEREPEQITPLVLDFEHGKKHYTGMAIPILTSCEEGMCQRFDITLNDEHVGILRHAGDKWKIGEIKSQALANALGAQIEAIYQE